MSPTHDITTRGGSMTVVEWLAPVRNLDWVAACFGKLDL
jgi:hypothetical protein